jgi:hypothetical protein
MSIDLDSLSYILMPGGVPKTAWRGYYVEAFRCWQMVWSKTLDELDHQKDVFADDFTRQTAIGGIFWRERCLALGFFHHVDFTFATAAKDSYFKVWPLAALARLTEAGPKVVVGSNITVDPEFRGDIGNGVQLKNVLIALMVKTFLASDQDAMTGTMRVNRNMHRAAQRFGGVPLADGILHHGVEVELVAFYRQALLAEAHRLPDLGAEKLWRGRVDFCAANSHEKLLRTGG